MSEYERPTFEDQRRVETLFDPMRFNRLLQLAEQICLRRVPDYSKIELPKSPESDIVAALGVRGLRAAIEMTQDVSTMVETVDDEDSMDVDKLIFHPLYQPEFYGGPQDQEMTAKVTAFGDAIIGEAYKVLGADADTQADKFRQATSKDEQIEVLLWLNNRLHKMGTSKRGLPYDENDTNTSDDEDDVDLPYYHPSRLSPKIIGSYPDYKLAPTCLSVSMIAAGFMKKAGADYMHAGVMETERQDEMTHIFYLIDSFINVQSDRISNDLKERLSDKAKEVREGLIEDRGNHSAIVVRLVNGDWFQLDPNYDILAALPLISNESDPNILNHNIDKTYQTLKDLENVAPGLEISNDLRLSSLPMRVVEYLSRAMDFNVEIYDRLDSLLRNLDDESTIEPFRQLLVGDIFFKKLDDSDSLGKLLQEKYLTAYEKPTPDGYMENLISGLFYDAFTSFVQWDMPIDEWRMRCKSDTSFRDKRIDDMLQLPFIVGIMYCLEMLDRNRQRAFHSKLEYGLPETRIGMSVLNNIAIYLGDELTAHHWLSQWSSHIALMDKLDNGKRSRAQNAVLGNNVIYYTENNLRYAAHSGRTTSFWSSYSSDSESNPKESGESIGTKED